MELTEKETHIARLRNQGHVVITADEFVGLTRDIAKEGAQEALAAVGLSGPNAREDVWELLRLLRSYRLLREGFMKGLGRLFLVGALIAAATVYGLKDGLPFK